ncbi:hypothetical protein [Mesorhizobium sp. A556]
MRLIRSLTALALLKAGFWLLDRAGGLLADKPGPFATRYRPVERMLLGSIIGLAICTLWIWISARAGR